MFYSATYPYCRKACRGVIHPSLVHPCLSGMSCCRRRWLCQCRQTVAGLRLPTLTAHPASAQGHRSASTDTETPLSIGRRYDTPLANYRRPRAGTRVDRYAHRRSPKHHVFPYTPLWFLYAPTRPALARTAKQHARRRAVMEPLDRIELSTCSLRVSRSTD